MTQEEIRTIVERQRAFFRAGGTREMGVRLAALARLRDAVRRYEPGICAALQADLGKSACESYLCEVGMALSELTYMLRHAPRFAQEKTVPTPLAQFPARSFQKPAPYGVSLIMSPWNYPFLLTIEPLTDAIAAGNTAVLKPSAYSPSTSAVIQRLVEECFEPEYVAVVTGGRAENTALLGEHFDCIFFTGSQAVGREVMRRAAEHLTPVTLELGGKSPCIVERSADLKIAARRIVFGKFLNCGQTCVAPDYILCDASVKDALIEQLKLQIRRQFGAQPLLNPSYGRVVNEKHFDRLLGLLDPAKTVWGGESRRESLCIEPTILDGVTLDDPVMGEEIFGPIVPVLTDEDLDGALDGIEARPHPLAFYIFTGDRALARRAMERCSFGGGCVNDVIIHLATSELPFGGFGESGMGSYHGKAGFDAFTHYKSIVDKGTWLDLPMRYQPYKKVNEKLARLFLR